jgi:hypothetical protein
MLSNRLSSRPRGPLLRHPVEHTLTCIEHVGQAGRRCRSIYIWALLTNLNVWQSPFIKGLCFQFETNPVHNSLSRKITMCKEYFHQLVITGPRTHRLRLLEDVFSDDSPFSLHLEDHRSDYDIADLWCTREETYSFASGGTIEFVTRLPSVGFVKSISEHNPSLTLHLRFVEPFLQVAGEATFVNGKGQSSYYSGGEHYLRIADQLGFAETQEDDIEADRQCVAVDQFNLWLSD